jgi:hypothetical protein
MSAVLYSLKQGIGENLNLWEENTELAAEIKNNLIQWREENRYKKSQFQSPGLLRVRLPVFSSLCMNGMQLLLFS